MMSILQFPARADLFVPMPTFTGPRLRGAVLWSLIAGIVLGVGGCSLNPAVGISELVLFDEDEEAAIGELAHPRILKAYGGAYTEGGIEAYVGQIVRRIAQNSAQPDTAQPDLAYTVSVLDSSVVNAFSLPGRYVYVTRGLLAAANDEAELAGVLAHEMAHVDARHAAQRRIAVGGTSVLGSLTGLFLGKTVADGIFSRGTQGVLAGYSREQEREADRLAVSYLERAGYDPFALRDFLQSMDNDVAFQARWLGEAYDADHTGWLSSHPAMGARVSGIDSYAAQLAHDGAVSERGKERFYAAIDGLAYGENREDGYIRGRDFIHAVERYRFQVPLNFHLVNSRDAVWVIGRDKVIVKFDTGFKEAAHDIVSYLRNDWAAAFVLQEVRRFEINGLAAVSARTRLRGLDTHVVAIEAGSGLVYRFLVGVPPQVGDRYDAVINTMIESFRMMSVREAASVKPQRLRIVSVRAGTPYADLARQMVSFEDPLARFRLLNALPQDEVLSTGQPVKLVVEGN